MQADTPAAVAAGLAVEPTVHIPAAVLIQISRLCCACKLGVAFSLRFTRKENHGRDTEDRHLLVGGQPASLADFTLVFDRTTEIGSRWH